MELWLVSERAFWFYLGGAVAYGCTTLATTDQKIPAWFKMLVTIIWPISLISVLRTYVKGFKRVNS